MKYPISKETNDWVHPEEGTSGRSTRTSLRLIPTAGVLAGVALASRGAPAAGALVALSSFLFSESVWPLSGGPSLLLREKQVDGK